MAFLIAVFATSFFSWALPQVEQFRHAHPEIMWALPVLALFVMWDRRRPGDILFTRTEVKSLNHDPTKPLRPAHVSEGLKLIFMTLAAHAVGASVGREAVGLQIGGWSARLRGVRGWYFAACMAAGFAVVLGTPVTAAVFIFESKRWRLSWTDWFAIPLFSWIAFQLSIALGVSHTELHAFAEVFGEIEAIGWLRFAAFVLLLTVSAAFIAWFFLFVLFRTGSRRSLWNPWAVCIAALLVFAGLGFGPAESMGLPGLGVSILSTLWTTEPSTLSLHPLGLAILKTFLTATFVGVGIRGGEFTPLLIVGTILGVGLAMLLKLPTMAVMALGMPVVWGIAARRPIAAAILAVELFGFAPWGFLAVVTFVIVWCGMRAVDKMTQQMFWRRGLYDE